MEDYLFIHLNVEYLNDLQSDQILEKLIYSMPPIQCISLSGDKYLSFPDILIRYTFVEVVIGYLRNANFEIVH